MGCGGFGEVFAGEWLGTPVALKRVNIHASAGGDQSDPSRGLVAFLKEVRVLSQLRHPHCVLLLGACLEPEKECIITEFMPKGSVFDLLHGSTSGRNGASSLRVDLPVKIRIIQSCAKGMAYLHTHAPSPIVHRDLKSANLLVDHDGTIKVCDFGLASSRTTVTTLAVGTPQWAAPEVLRKDEFSTRSDVFSFGCVIWEVMVERIPFDGMTPVRVAHEVAYNGLRENIDDVSSALSTGEATGEVRTALMGLLRECWSEDPAERPTMCGIVRRC